MKLHDYLSQRKIAETEFAALVGASVHAVRKWRYLDRIPRKKALAKIRAVTGGKVTANDFVEAA